LTRNFGSRSAKCIAIDVPEERNSKGAELEGLTYDAATDNDDIGRRRRRP
jgi:hypothetical protein